MVRSQWLEDFKNKYFEKQTRLSQMQLVIILSTFISLKWDQICESRKTQKILILVCGALSQEKFWLNVWSIISLEGTLRRPDELDHWSCDVFLFHLIDNYIRWKFRNFLDLIFPIEIVKKTQAKGETLKIKYLKNW